MSSRSVAARATFLASAVAGGTLLVVLGALPLCGLFLQGFDLARVDLGLACATRHALREASLYLSTLLGNGGALLARPDAQLFYPLRWLVVWLPEDWAVALFPSLHYALAAAGAAWLARTFRARPLAAASVGIAFAFSGTAVNLLQHGQHYVVAAAWLPVGWAAARRALHPRGRRIDLALLAAALAGLLLGGDPQSFLVLGALVALECARARPWSRRPARARAARVAACLPASFALCLVAWAPMLAESALTSRAAALSAKEVLAWAFLPSDVLGVLLPNALFRPLQAPANLYILLHGPGAGTWNTTPYLGALLVAASLAAWRLRDLRVAAAVCFAGFVLALGDALPVLPVLMKLMPVVAWFRYPAKYLLVASLAGTVAAGVMLERAARDRRARRALQIAGLPLAVALAGGLAFVVVRASWLDALASGRSGAAAPLPAFLPSLSEMLTQATAHALTPLAAALALLASRSRLRSLVPALLAVDLAFFALGAYQLGPPLARAGSPLTRVVAKPGAPSPVWCSDERLDGVEQADSLSPDAAQYLFRRRWGVPDQQACDGLVGAIAYSPQVSTATMQLVGAMSQGSLGAARAAGCTHIVSSVRFAGTTPVDVGPGAFVGELPDPIPEVSIARGPRLVPSSFAALQAVSASTSAQALSGLDDPLGRLGAEPRLPTGANAQILRLERPSTSDFRLELSGTGGAVAVVRAAFLVGWSARQADRELALVRSAGSHLAVVVPDVSAGPVLLQYRPPRLVPGMVGSLVGGLLLAALLLSLRRRAAAGSGSGSGSG
ncbi:MAG TPA: hypothetical protein VGK67_11485 [Myxococcales bacterium]